MARRRSKSLLDILLTSSRPRRTTSRRRTTRVVASNSWTPPQPVGPTIDPGRYPHLTSSRGAMLRIGGACIGGSFLLSILAAPTQSTVVSGIAIVALIAGFVVLVLGMNIPSLASLAVEEFAKRLARYRAKENEPGDPTLAWLDELDALQAQLELTDEEVGSTTKAQISAVRASLRMQRRLQSEPTLPVLDGFKAILGDSDCYFMAAGMLHIGQKTDWSQVYLTSTGILVTGSHRIDLPWNKVEGTRATPDTFTVDARGRKNPLIFRFSTFGVAGNANLVATKARALAGSRLTMLDVAPTNTIEIVPVLKAPGQHSTE